MGKTFNVKKLTLDLDLLTNLGRGNPSAFKLLTQIRENYWSPFVCPTVVEELRHTSVHRQGVPQEIALRVLTCLRKDWNILPFESDSVMHHVAEAFVHEVFDRGLLPRSELNSALTLAETSVAEIPVLATINTFLLRIPRARLRRVFEDRSMIIVEIVHPNELWALLEEVA